MSALQFGEHVTKRLSEFVFRIGPDDEGLVDSLAEALNRIGCAGTEDFGVGLDREELRKREVLFLKAEPSYGLTQMAVLHLVLSMAGKFHRRRPALFDAEFRKERMPSGLEHAPEFRDEPERAKIENHLVREIVTD